ncbi:F-box/LRR-repeat protein 18-like [Asterias rubens]|uniref:F-box/LRR-repeat protein 18-like n=1 Tax=Asterias rubens TaxID=7604 RepID=UPI00145580A6|nr:F-box/LRR-repeat protein 18-like [Asterias rubens]
MAAPKTPPRQKVTEGSFSVSHSLAEVKTQRCLLEMLPTELLMSIMGYLSTLDLLALREVDRIFCEVIDGSTLFRSIDLHQSYRVTPHTLWELGRLNKISSIRSFNISNCYWLTASQLSTCILNPKMTNLKHLDIRGSNVPMRTLDRILSSAQTLKSLSYNHSAPFGEVASKTLSQLVELNMVISHRCDFTFLNHCESLRVFTLDLKHQLGTQNSAFSYRYIPPILLELPLSCLLRLHHIDFLGEAQKPFRSYRAYGLRFPRGVMKALRTVSSSLTACLGDSEELDLSKILSLESASSDEFPISSRFSSLRHLNVSGTSFTKTELCSAGENLPRLKSLNIRGCKNVLLTEGDRNLDLSFLEVLVEAKSPLEHLNISRLHLHHPDDDNRLTQLLGQFHGLKSLSLPLCCLADKTTSEPLWMKPSHRIQTYNTRSHRDTQGSTSRRQRLGIRVNEHGRCESCMNETTSPVDTKEVDFKGCIYCGSHLARVVNGARQLQSLELVGVAFKSVLKTELHKSSSAPKQANHCGPSSFSSVSEDAFLCISRWTQLHSLVLAGIPTFLHGHSLVEILKNCKQLRSLTLANLGPSAKCQYLKGLVEALKYADRLEDLRLEQRNIDRMHSLFEALHQCHSLTRLCVISTNSEVDAQDVLMVFNHCRKLILFCLMSSVPVQVCKDLSKEIYAQYSLSRPALCVAFGQNPQFEDKLLEFAKRIQRVHLKEFVFYESRVATTPPSWPELEKMIREQSC